MVPVERYGDVTEWEETLGSQALQGTGSSADLGIEVTGTNTFSPGLFCQDEPAATIFFQLPPSFKFRRRGGVGLSWLGPARRGSRAPWGLRSPTKSPLAHRQCLSPFPQHVQLLRRRLPQLGPGSQPVPGLRRPRRRGLDEEAGLPLPAGEGDVQHLQEQRRG